MSTARLYCTECEATTVHAFTHTDRTGARTFECLACGREVEEVRAGDIELDDDDEPVDYFGDERGSTSKIEVG